MVWVVYCLNEDEMLDIAGIFDDQENALAYAKEHDIPEYCVESMKLNAGRLR